MHIAIKISFSAFFAVSHEVVSIKKVGFHLRFFFFSFFEESLLGSDYRLPNRIWALSSFIYRLFWASSF
jgi:hypothetical protein